MEKKVTKSIKFTFLHEKCSTVQLREKVKNPRNSEGKEYRKSVKHTGGIYGRLQWMNECDRL
uniref:Uncharacterized protein n=1 Tax=Onchocerca volvulus TaxID=6282 RepID=A0A8R1Y3B8_ONCVO